MATQSSLFTYSKQVAKFLHDTRQSDLNPRDIVQYVNLARREVAERTQCVRRLTPISGAISGWTVTNGGTGYSNNPTFTVTPPDFPSGNPINPNGLQATATGIVQSGVITAIFSQVGGAGYFQPQMTITDSTGKGATATPIVAGVNKLNPGQESYNFSDIDVSGFPGVDSVLAIKSVSVIYANYLYSLPMYAFSVYQAKIRQYPFQYQYVPCFCSQFGQGNAGSFYAYPIPSQTYQWEFDLFCIPQDLVDDQSVDVIPKPWDDAVPFYAAAYCYLNLQNMNAAEYFFKKFDDVTLRKSNYARIGRVVNPYGRV
jgi:hypothetical protein